MAKRIAILTPNFGSIGGLTSWALFLRKAICEHSEHDVTIVSVATSRNDDASRCALRPSSWINCPTVVTRFHNGISFSHVGAVLAEVEPLRYCPHRALNAILRASEIVVIVSGTPAWACLATQCNRPIILLTASFAATERAQSIQTTDGFASLWKQGMTQVVSRMELHALQQATKVFVLNRDAEERVVAAIGRSRVERVAVGVDVTTFSPAAVYSEDGYLLVVGRMNDPRKNLPLLLSSYAAVRARMPSAPALVIAGDPLESESLRLIASAGLSQFVNFVHSPTNDELASLYRRASLVLIPSAEEGFGIVAVEAMACGIPVIGTRCVGLEESIIEGETGYLVPLDPDLFAEKVTEALMNPAKRRHMGRTARSIAEERYSTSSAGKPYVLTLSQL